MLTVDRQPPEEGGGKVPLWQGHPVILCIQCLKTKGRPVSWLCFARTLAFPSHLHVALGEITALTGTALILYLESAHP